MSSSLKLFSILGIDIRMHITFPLILVWAAIQFGLIAAAGPAGALFGVIVVLGLFVIVTLHELGHSVAARRFGVGVREITLLPIGGVAQLEEIPERPREEFIVAIAGPAVNAVIAILFLPVFALGLLDLMDPVVLLQDLEAVTVSGVFTYLFIYNIFLGLFNLLPAFPMDGGRVLRALLATQLRYTQATSIAATVGRVTALFLGLWGFVGGGLFLIFIAFFVYIGAGHEERLAQLRAMLRGVQVDQVYSRNVRHLSPDNTLREAVEATLSGFQATFPVIDNGEFLGLVNYSTLLQGLDTHSRETPLREIMLTDPPQVAPGDDLYDVQRQLDNAANQLDAVPVLRGATFVGMLTLRDISEAFRLRNVDPTLLAQSV
ncbi:MAG: site-2 protease family protein [Anaerolineales bacterium]